MESTEASNTNKEVETTCNNEEKNNIEDEDVKGKFLYSKFRGIATYSQLAGTFPFKNAIFNKDGRLLQFCPFRILYGIIITTLFSYWYTVNCQKIIDNRTNDDYALLMWITLTYYLVISRTIILFILLNIAAPRVPRLFAAIEEYYQVIGKSIIQPNKHPRRDFIVSIIFMLIFISTIQITSCLFYRQFNSNLTMLQTWPICLSYLFACGGKDLPLEMFIKLCLELLKRLKEISKRVREIRISGVKDLGKDLELVRLQHSALLKIIGLLQDCYGMQLTAILVYMIGENVISLFVFFAITYSENFWLLLIPVFNLFECVCCLSVVERLQKTDETLLTELSEFEEYRAPKEEQVQVQLFFSQVITKPVKLSASGFFYINNHLLTGILGAIASYLVMAVQFAPYIESIVGNDTNVSPWILKY